MRNTRDNGGARSARTHPLLEGGQGRKTRSMRKEALLSALVLSLLAWSAICWSIWKAVGP